MKHFLRETITRAGEMSLEYRRRLKTLEVLRKSRNDLVSEADIAIERYIVEAIRRAYPRHAIEGEESGSVGGSEYRWIIDPIDGTTSFVHGQPYYSISVAVEKAGEYVLGAVNAPAMGELYEAQVGAGAMLNGEPISVSRTADLSDSVMSTGFSCIRFDHTQNNLAYFNALVPRLRDVRRYGSAALDLSYVACGRLEGFWELYLKIFDVAAGFLIVSEAGGRWGDFHGRKEGVCQEVLATNGLIHEQVMELFASVDRQIQQAE